MIKLKQFVLAGILLYSCGNKNSLPEGILKPAKMQTVLWDVLRADAFTFDFIKRDTAKVPEVENVKLQQQIFAIHKITKDDFYKSYNYYTKHTELLQPLLDSMVANAERNKYALTRASKMVTADSLIKK